MSKIEVWMKGFLLEACRIQLNRHVYLCPQKYATRNKGLERPHQGEVGFHPRKNKCSVAVVFMVPFSRLSSRCDTLNPRKSNNDQGCLCGYVFCCWASLFEQGSSCTKILFTWCFTPFQQSPAGYRNGCPPLLNSNHYQQMLDYSWCYIALPDATPLRPSSMILSYDPVKQQHIPQPGSAWGDWSLYTDSPLRAFENETGVTWQEIFTWWW